MIIADGGEAIADLRFQRGLVIRVVSMLRRLADL